MRSHPATQDVVIVGRLPKDERLTTPEVLLGLAPPPLTPAAPADARARGLSGLGRVGADVTVDRAVAGSDLAAGSDVAAATQAGAASGAAAAAVAAAATASAATTSASAAAAASAAMLPARGGAMALERLADLISEMVDLTAVLRLGGGAIDSQTPPPPAAHTPHPPTLLSLPSPPLQPSVGASSAAVTFTSALIPPVRIGVAWDDAFCFYYEDNLQQLRRAGVSEESKPARRVSCSSRPARRVSCSSKPARRVSCSS